MARTGEHHDRRRTERLQKGDVGYIPPARGDYAITRIVGSGCSLPRMLIGFNPPRISTRTIEMFQRIAVVTHENTYARVTNLGQLAERLENFRIAC